MTKICSFDLINIGQEKNICWLHARHARPVSNNLILLDDLIHKPF